MSVWRQTGNSAAPGEVERRGIGLLLDGVILQQVQADEGVYRRLRSAILRDSLTLAEPQPKDNMLAAIRSILSCFEAYRTETESLLDARRKAWQQLSLTLLHRLAEELRIDPDTGEWKSLCADLNAVTEAEQILDLRNRALQQVQKKVSASRHAREKEERDRSTENDNAAGLRGGGAAIEHIEHMLEVQRPGFVVIFRLSCLDVIGKRFGSEGVQDCLMTVAAFLMENIRREDTIYYWSESSLLAVCDRKVREEMISAEFNRVLARNRDFTLQVGERAIMLRIPIEMQLYPVEQLKSVDDLLKLAEARQRERLLSGRP